MTCGIDAISLVVRNEATFNFDPIWFFTDKSIPGYLANSVWKGWNKDRIRAMVEGYVLSKCDVQKVSKSSKAKAKQLQGLIQRKIHELLSVITKNDGIKMSYKNFEHDIVVEHGIDIKGWTHPMFNSPSKLSTSLPPLQTLLDALNSSSCYVYRLSASEHKNWKAEYELKVAAGEVAPRKTRSDAGRPHSKRTKSSKSLKPTGEEPSDDESSSDNEDGAPACKRRHTAAPKSREIIEESD